jgi:3-hydroxybutyryl-CoA dehydrogenase
VKLADVDSLLKKDVQKEKLTASESEDIKKRVQATTEISSSTLSSLDFVIEAVSENPSLKATIFKQLASECPAHAILASNTSSVGITKIAASAIGAQDRVIGMHFMVCLLRGTLMSESGACDEGCRDYYGTTNFGRNATTNSCAC